MQRAIPCSVYYDNNAYRMSGPILEKVSARESELGITGIASPYVIRELTGHLSKDRQSEKFQYALSALHRLREHCKTADGKCRMYGTMEEVIALAIFSSKTLPDDNSAELARILRHCTKAPPEEWSDNLREVLAAWAEHRERSDKLYRLHHAEDAAIYDTFPTLVDMFRPINTKRQGETLTKALLAKQYGLSGPTLDAEAVRHAPFYVAAMKDADAVKRRIGPRLMADYMAQLHGGWLLDEDRDKVIDALLADFPVPFAHRERYMAGVIAGASADPNDFTDYMLTWQIPARMLKTKPPAVLITSDAGILEVAGECQTIMSMSDYLKCLGVSA